MTELDAKLTPCLNNKLTPCLNKKLNSKQCLPTRAIIHFLSIVFAALMLASSAHAAPPMAYWSFWDKSNEGSTVVVNHQPWSTVLQNLTVPDEQSGIVYFRYQRLSPTIVKTLGAYVDSLEAIDPRGLAKLEQKAYWLNLYNVLTVLAVADNLDELKALETVDANQLLKPKHWKKKRVKIARKRLSLLDIHHRILRPLWQDHRVFFGINCLTRECPNMATTAYTAATIKEQLHKAGTAFINNNVGVEYKEGELYVSAMFEDYLQDFAKDEKTFTKVLVHYTQDMKALYLLGFSGQIQYRRDTRLNIATEDTEQAL